MGYQLNDKVRYVGENKSFYKNLPFIVEGIYAKYEAITCRQTNIHGYRMNMEDVIPWVDDNINRTEKKVYFNILDYNFSIYLDEILQDMPNYYNLATMYIEDNDPIPPHEDIIEWLLNKKKWYEYNTLSGVFTQEIVNNIDELKLENITIK